MQQVACGVQVASVETADSVGEVRGQSSDALLVGSAGLFR